MLCARGTLRFGRGGVAVVVAVAHVLAVLAALRGKAWHWAEAPHPIIVLSALRPILLLAALVVRFP